MTHRIALLVRDWDALWSLVAANPRWLTMQFVPAESLLTQPLDSLWYLQGMPPIPNVVLGVLLRLVPTPEHLVVPLLACQWVATAAAAVLVVVLGRRLMPEACAWILGILWGFSPDAVVLEATNFGQGFYENLTLVGLLLIARQIWSLGREGRMRTSLTIGALVALVALTRSSYGYFLLPAAGVVWTIAGRNVRWRLAAVALAVPLALQGGWALKNLAVFGHFTWPASTWAGASVAGSIRALGHSEPFLAETRDHLDEHPPWFGRYLDVYGSNPWHAGSEAGSDAAFCPEELRAQDEVALRALADHNRYENTQCQRVVSEEFEKAAVRFYRHHPGLLVHKLRLGYALYWHPIRYHHYLGTYWTEWRVERPLRVGRSIGLLVRGELPESHFVQSGAAQDLARTPARLYTLDLPVTLWWIVEILVLHLLTPFVVVRIGLRWWRRQQLEPEDGVVLFLSVLYLYAAVVHNAVEFGENMRFRWNVEPLIWLLVATTLVRAGRFVRALRGRAAAQSV